MTKRTRNPDTKGVVPPESALTTLCTYYADDDSQNSEKISPNNADLSSSEDDSPPPKKACATDKLSALSDLVQLPEGTSSQPSVLTDTTLEPTQVPSQVTLPEDDDLSPPPIPPSQPSTAPPATRQATSPSSSQATNSATQYSCPSCTFRHSSIPWYAQHIRTTHDSSWKPGPHQPTLQHCACGLLYASGSSLTLHSRSCACLEAGHRRLGPHPGCPCAGCAATPLEPSYCDDVSCARGQPAHQAPSPSPAAPTGPPAPTPTPVPPTTPVPPPATPTPLTFQGGSAGEGSIPIAKLTLIHEFEFTAAELDVSVVQRLFHNQLRRVTQCYNMVFLSLRRYSEVEGVALEILLAHVKLLLLIPKMLMTRLPMRRQGNTARAGIAKWWFCV